MISVIIPTLQKDVKILRLLIETLSADEAVSEIILIDNSCKGVSFSCDKMKVITPEANLFVNPSWNLGVKEAKNELFVLFNDDLLVCENFCSQVLSQIESKESFGVLGMSSQSVINTATPTIPEVTKFEMVEDNGDRPNNWGTIIFGKKSTYQEIPDQIKILCGDDFIRFVARKNGLKVFMLEGAIIYHLGSLSSGNPKLKKLLKKDLLEYAKYDPSFKKTEYYKWARNKFLVKITDFLFKKKVTKSGKLIIKICKIPVCSKKIDIEEKPQNVII